MFFSACRSRRGLEVSSARGSTPKCSGTEINCLREDSADSRAELVLDQQLSRGDDFAAQTALSKRMASRKVAAKTKATTKAKSPATKRKSASSTGSKSKPRAGRATKPKLLSGGNPQIAKGLGDAPVQAYITATPGWKREIAERIDALVTKAVPHVQKAVKWNSPFYGVEGQGWFLNFHMFPKYVKVAFFRGAALQPLPPEESKHKDVRYVNIREGELDEAQMTKWAKQAAALPGWVV